MNHARSLASQHPGVAAQWHPHRNGDLRPGDVSAKANRKAWWLGECGHEWEALISNRANGSRCPYCHGRKVLAGFNDLATTHPALAAQWHPDRNGDLAPSGIKAGSSTKAWWFGDCGHEFAASVKDRAGKGSGCPVCGGNAVLAGHNDLAATRPDVAALWHPERNRDLTPAAVSHGSRQRVWWLGGCGHEWQMTPNQMTGRATGCPVCAGRRVLAGFNDLATTHPDLAAQWHPNRNGALAARDVTAGSNKRVWWLADCGHDWEACVYDRAGSRESGCPRCSHRVSRGEEALYAAVAALVGTIGTIQRNARAYDGLEADLVITVAHRVLAVEYNGVYYHSEKFQGRDSHRRKRDAVLDAGHDFLAVWEDDWRDRPDVVLAAIAHRLGLATSTLPRRGARTLDLRPAARADADALLDAHHLQGRPSPSTTHLGLYDGTTLRAVLSTRSRGTTHEIVRFAAAGAVPGAFTRLLTAAERGYPDVERWVTFADHAVSAGALYAAAGFTAEKVLAPDYSYVGNRTGWTRVHKSNFRLARFRDDPTLTWVDDASERDLADMNGLLRVWDYGKTRWVKRVVRP